MVAISQLLIRKSQPRSDKTTFSIPKPCTPLDTEEHPGSFAATGIDLVQLSTCGPQRERQPRRVSLTRTVGSLFWPGNYWPLPCDCWVFPCPSSLMRAEARVYYGFYARCSVGSDSRPHISLPNTHHEPRSGRISGVCDYAQ